jgi:hypothetical protein
MTIYKELSRIQKELKAPKNQYNNFGKYHYRNVEDILEGLKECLNGCSVMVEDEVIFMEGRFYIKATATLFNDKGEHVKNSAFAREEDSKKGMDSSMLTGSASSYARKYALNGLFAIDDNKDADAIERIEDALEGVENMQQLSELFKKLPESQQKKMQKKFSEKKKELKDNESAA